MQRGADLRSRRNHGARNVGFANLTQPDGKTAYYTIRRAEYPWEKMVVSRLSRGHWSPPEDLPFSGTYFDTDAFVSLEGRTLSRATGRSISIAIARAALALGISTVRAVAGRATRHPRTSAAHRSVERSLRDGARRGKFAPAWNLGPLVNTAADEYHPMLRADQNRLHFVRQEVNPPGDSQFYVADARCVFCAFAKRKILETTGAAF